MHLIRLLMIVFLLVSLCFFCSAQVSDEQAKSIAVTAIRKKINFSESKPFRIHRREDLEDDLFGLQVKIKGQIAKAVFFYEVTENGYFVLSPNEAIYATSNDGSLSWVAAISTKTGELYGLSGFENSELAFNRLAKDAKLSISTEGQAYLYALLYNRVVNDLSDSNLVLDERQARHKAENYFYMSYSAKNASSLFQSWLAGFAKAKRKAKLGITVTQGLGEYLATITYFTYLSSNKKKIPQLNSYTISISSDGLSKLNTRSVIYPKM